MNIYHFDFIYDFMECLEIEILNKTCKKIHNFIINNKLIKHRMIEYYYLKEEKFKDYDNYISFILNNYSYDDFKYKYYSIKIFINSASNWCYDSNSRKCIYRKSDYMRCEHYCNYGGRPLCEIICNFDDKKNNILYYLELKKLYNLLVNKYKEFNNLYYDTLPDYLYNQIELFTKNKKLTDNNYRFEIEFGY